MRTPLNKRTNAAVKRNRIIQNGKIHAGFPDGIGQADLIAARSGTYFRPPQAIEFLASLPSNEQAAPVQAIAFRVAFRFVPGNLSSNLYGMIPFGLNADFRFRIQTVPLIMWKQIQRCVPVRRETQFDEFFRANLEANVSIEIDCPFCRGKPAMRKGFVLPVLPPGVRFRYLRAEDTPAGA